MRAVDFLVSRSINFLPPIIYCFGGKEIRKVMMLLLPNRIRIKPVLKNEVANLLTLNLNIKDFVKD